MWDKSISQSTLAFWPVTEINTHLYDIHYLWDAHVSTFYCWKIVGWELLCVSDLFARLKRCVSYLQGKVFCCFTSTLKLWTASRVTVLSGNWTRHVTLSLHDVALPGGENRHVPLVINLLWMFCINSFHWEEIHKCTNREGEKAETSQTETTSDQRSTLSLKPGANVPQFFSP